MRPFPSPIAPSTGRCVSILNGLPAVSSTTPLFVSMFCRQYLPFVSAVLATSVLVAFEWKVSGHETIHEHFQFTCCSTLRTYETNIHVETKHVLTGYVTRLLSIPSFSTAHCHSIRGHLCRPYKWVDNLAITTPHYQHHPLFCSLSTHLL